MIRRTYPAAHRPSEVAGEDVPEPGCPNRPVLDNGQILAGIRKTLENGMSPDELLRRLRVLVPVITEDIERERKKAIV